jgi:hypothetical protein
MAIFAAQGVPVQLQFPCFDVDGVTPISGLTDVDFGRYLAVDGTASAVTSTVFEISLGRYYIEFTPNADGLWYVEVMTTEEDVFTFEVQVGPLPADVVVDIVDAVWSEPLPGAYPAGSAGERLASTDDRTELLTQALVMANLAALAGSTTTTVNTGAVQANGFYDGLVVVVRNAAGSVARRIASYSGGVFTVAPALPFTPTAGDQVIVLGQLGEVAIAGDTGFARKLCEIHRILGLDPEAPLCVSKGAQTAGDITLIHTEVGKSVRVKRQE